MSRTGLHRELLSYLWDKNHPRRTILYSKKILHCSLKYLIHTCILYFHFYPTVVVVKRMGLKYCKENQYEIHHLHQSQQTTRDDTAVTDWNYPRVKYQWMIENRHFQKLLVWRGLTLYCTVKILEWLNENIKFIFINHKY